MRREKNSESKFTVSKSCLIGIIALVFLVIGYQAALFVHRAAVMTIEAKRDSPDTVYIYAPESGNLPEIGKLPESIPKSSTAARKDNPAASPSTNGNETFVQRRNAEHSPRVEAVRKNTALREVRCFNFDPNTASIEDLCLLGFSPKQAASIDAYRQKGGRFHRKSDFAKSYVVSDSVYLRLEPYIVIPKLDLNLADSAQFDALPGIGGFFASKMVEYRQKLGGYSSKEQLMEIYKFDSERYGSIEDLVTVSPEHITPYPLWRLGAEELALHPYIRSRNVAQAIVMFRTNTKKSLWSIERLASEGILNEEAARKLSGIIIEPPE